MACDAEHSHSWRRYERTFGHRLAITGGAYWQEFSSFRGSARCSSRFSNTIPWFELRYGVNWKRAVYDGGPTPSAEGFIHVNLRFH